MFDYPRAVAVCCRAWGISPREFEAGEFSQAEVMDTIELSCSCEDGVVKYLFKTELEKREEKKARIIQLVMRFKNCTDPEKKKELAAMIEEENR